MLNIRELGREIIKDSNRKKILNLLYEKKELTKMEIAKQTGVSIPTVINNVNFLLEEGIVAEKGVATSTGGRKPVIIAFLPDARFSFGVDIRPDAVQVIMTNLYSEIKFQDNFSIDGIGAFDSIMDKIIGIVDGHIESQQIPREKILGIGFSLPGTVDEENLVLNMAPNMNIKDIYFGKYAERFDFPVYIENEANAAAFGEMILGIGKEMKNLVYISITQGIGTGIVIQDHLYKGKNKRAGEFGHATIVSKGKPCNCGKRGCWELYASEKALLKKYNENAPVKIKQLDDFFSLIRENVSGASNALAEYVDFLAIGIQNIILGLDPHYIIIGGQISAYQEHFMETLKKAVFEGSSLFSMEDTVLFASKLEGASSILGASLLPLQTLFFIREKII